MFKYLDRRNYEPYCHQILYQLSKGNETFLHRMSLLKSLDVHHGCVNSVVWDDAGELLLSGSDDQQLIISNPWSGNTSVKLHTAHRANIFSAKFIPYSSNRHIISCSGDGMLSFTDLDRIPETFNCKFNCHIGTCYDVLTIASDPYSFFSCGEDGTVRWFDLRVKTSCLMQDCKEDILLNMRRAVTAIAINPLVHYQLAVSTQDSTTQIYDRRMLGTKAHDSFLTESNQAVLMKLRPDCLEGKNHRITSLRYSAEGDMVLASYSSDYLYLFDIQNSKAVPLEMMHGEHSLHDEDSSSGPILKRLRLRGDWSDTGPQAVPESELRNQAEDVGQARPTLHSTLMQRMTDILSRMLPNPSTRSSSRLRNLEERIPCSGLEQSSAGNDIFNPGEIVSDRASNSSGLVSHGDEETVRETSSAPASITAHSPSNIISGNLEVDQHLMLSEVPVIVHQSSYLPIPNEASLENSLSSLPRAGGMLLDSGSYSDSTSQQPCSTVTSLESSGPIETSPQERNCAYISNSFTLENENRTLNLPKNNEYSMNESPSSNMLPGDQQPCNIASDCAPFPANPVLQSSISCVTQHADDICSSSSTLMSDIAIVSDANSINVVNTTVASPNICSINDHSESGTREPHLLFSDTDNNSGNEVCSTMETSSKETSALRGDTVNEEPSQSIPEQFHAYSLLSDAGPSTSAETLPANISENLSNRRSPKRRVQAQDEVAEEDTPERRRVNTNSRLVRAIERVRQQRREERNPSNREEAVRKAEGEGYDKHISYGIELMQYKGHRNARTMIKEACFWGDGHVMSGSDCGRVFVWDKNTGRLVMLWEADRHVVNCLQPHPTLPILATSGIDYDIKLWAPICDDPKFDEENAIEIARRNEMLLAETRDTVTVPATFMIRMLASLNQLRRDRLRNRNRNDDEDEEEIDDDDD